ncbi:hypothetical protein NL676_001566 [Syzygium grande]|nr:hypothetical protein NL676_001566 [Syzygium grande]
MNRIVESFSQVTLKSNPNCSGMRANPVPRHPTACGPRARPSPADVVGPTHWWPLEPITMTNPRASASHRPAMVNQLNGTVHEPMNNGEPYFCTGVLPPSTGPRPPPLANVLANGSSFSTHGLENEGVSMGSHRSRKCWQYPMAKLTTSTVGPMTSRVALLLMRRTSEIQLVVTAMSVVTVVMMKLSSVGMVKI